MAPRLRQLAGDTREVEVSPQETPGASRPRSTGLGKAHSPKEYSSNPKPSTGSVSPQPMRRKAGTSSKMAW